MASTKSNIFVVICLILSVARLLPRVSSDQSFTEQPTDTSAIVGDAEVILKCAVANIAGDLIWEKDGDPIARASTRNRTTEKNILFAHTTVIGNHTKGEYNLRIANVRLQDDGIYKCYVTPSVNNSDITSTPAKLIIGRSPGPITITGSTTVVVGKPANLSCHSSGANPPATMTWMRDGQTVEGALYVTQPTANDASGKLSDSTSVLTVTPTKDDNTKTYECQATNMALDSPKTATITLDVQYPPTVTVQSPETELREETIVVFRCIVEANPRTVTYKWAKNGEVLTGAETGELEHALSRDDHNAIIGCAATNSIGTTEGSTTLDVKYGPKIIESPEGVSVDAGTPGSMTCTADGNPPPTIKWTRLGSRATLSTMTTLQFDSVRESDIGVYVCTAMVDGFDPVVSYGRLDLNGLPEIVSEPIQKAKLKGKAKLDCFTGTKPDPHKIVWSWDDSQIESGSKGRFSVLSEQTGGGVSSTLTITKVRTGDFREYNCTMTNDVGAQSFVITLQEEAMDLIIYIIIGVVATAMFVFLVTIVLMIYCKRRYQRRRAGKGQVEIEIVRKSDSEDSLDKAKRSGSNSPSSSRSKPRYADPHDYVPARRGSRATHDTWDEPIYHPTPYNPDWRNSYGDRFPRRSYSSNDYIEPEDLPHGTLPEWKDNFDDDKRKPRSVVDDKSYSSFTPERRNSRYQEPPTYDEFRDRYEEDDEYEKDWPDTSRRHSNDRYNDRGDHLYSNDPYYDHDDRDYDRDRYGNRMDYDDRGYDRLSNRGSDASYDSKQKLATNV